MEQKTDRLYPSAPKIRKKVRDVSSFNNLINNNIKEMITYFKDNDHKSKKKS